MNDVIDGHSANRRNYKKKKIERIFGGGTEGTIADGRAESESENGFVASPATERDVSDHGRFRVRATITDVDISKSVPKSGG